jgi:hypothetical protein
MRNHPETASVLSIKYREENRRKGLVGLRHFRLWNLLLNNERHH